MRILVFGAGAVGMWIGAALARKGHAVSLVARPLHVSAIRANGIHVASALGEHVVTGVHAVESTHDLAARSFDLVIVSVKSFDTRRAMHELTRVIDRHSIVMSIQNGLGNLEAMAAYADGAELLGSTVLTGIEVEGPGAVRVSTPSGTVQVGAHSGAKSPETAARIAEVLADAGIAARATDNIQRELWTKLLVNAVVNPLTALHGVCVADLPTRDGAVRIMDSIAREIFDVAGVLGVDLPWRHHEDFTRYVRAAILPRIGSHRTSMLQDLLCGRRTEIDAINGYVTALGRRHGVKTPVNAWITDLVKQKERHTQGVAA
jgi:2-dehydropantoate 2-reductase